MLIYMNFESILFIYSYAEWWYCISYQRVQLLHYSRV